MTLLLKAKSFNKCIWVGFCVIVSILYLFMTANLGNLSESSKYFGDILSDGQI